jgi:glutathionylspermidine synthase
MTEPIRAGDPIDAGTFAELRLRTIFECRKWDPQVGDVDVLCRFPLLMHPARWDELAEAAERMAAEADAAEQELLQRPELLNDLGLPRPITRILKRTRHDTPTDAPRAMRFDFHWTTDGWQISECNADVPGGWNEASGFSALVAEQYSNTRLAGDPTDALVRAIHRRVGQGVRVALLHATAYVDDRQVMQFIADRLLDVGLTPLLLSPAHLDWSDDRPTYEGPIDLLVRFFPAEWLINLRPRAAWTHFFHKHATPACNPASSLLIQSKRFPIVWDKLKTPTDAWRRYLPATRDPRDADWRGNPDWVLKPALGRVGEGIAMHGTGNEKEHKRITRAARLRPRYWIAQQRFHSVPIPTPQGPMHTCLGVYVVDGKAAGAYARVSHSALIDHQAVDAALLIEQPVAQHAEHPTNALPGATLA